MNQSTLIWISVKEILMMLNVIDALYLYQLWRKETPWQKSEYENFFLNVPLSFKMMKDTLYYINRVEHFQKVWFEMIIYGSTVFEEVASWRHIQKNASYFVLLVTSKKAKKTTYVHSRRSCCEDAIFSHALDIFKRIENTQQITDTLI